MSAIVTAADRELALDLTPDIGNPMVDYVAACERAATKIAEWRERELSRVRGLLPAPWKLRQIAQELDAADQRKGNKLCGTQMQDDLRRWAGLIMIEKGCSQ